MVRFSGRRLGAAVLAGMLAAAPFAAPAQAQQGKTLRVALVTGIDHLNPFTAELLAATQVGRLNYEFLTLPSAQDAQPTGGIAESWSASDDKLTWTYKIRPNMKWSDGKPVTAKDAAFTFNKMLTDATARTANGSYVTNFESVTASDDATLVIKTKTPQATMTALDVPIVPEHIWSSIADLKDPKTDSIDVVGVGSGPYLLTEYKQNEYVKFKANKDYWRGAPKVDALQLLKFSDAEAAVNALRQGEVDVINRLTPTQFDALKGQPNITTNEAPGRRYNEITFNHGVMTVDNKPIGDGNAALKDIKLRKALSQAIDPQVIVDRVMSGHGKVGTGVVPTAFPAYNWKPAAGELAKFDLAAAASALDAAGYGKGADGVRTVPGTGAKLELRLTGHSSRPFDQRTAEYVKAWFKDIGVTLKPDLVSDEELSDRTTSGNYDLAISGYSTSPDPDYALSLQTCAQRPNAEGKGGSTDTFFCDAEYEELYKQQLSEFDPVKRAEIVKKAQARLAGQAVNVVLDYDNVLEAYRSDSFSSFTKQPQPEGAILEQMGYWGYYGATPAGQAASNSDSGGGNTGLWIGIGVVVVIVLVGGGVLLAKRGKTADDRE